MKTVLRTGNEITYVHAYGNTYLTKEAYNVLMTTTLTPAQVKSVYSFPHVILTKVVNDQVELLEIKTFVLSQLGLISQDDMQHHKDNA